MSPQKHSEEDKEKETTPFGLSTIFREDYTSSAVVREAFPIKEIKQNSQLYSEVGYLKCCAERNRVICLLGIC